MHKYPRAFGHRMRIGLATSEIAVLRTEGIWRKRSALLADVKLIQDMEQSPEALRTECHNLLKDINCKGLPLNIVLANEWARLFIVTPPPNCVRMEDCEAAAAMRFQALYDAAPDDWQLQADWNVSKPFLACALPRSLLTVLQAIALEHEMALMTVAPQFIYSWNQWCKALQKGNWFGVVQGQTLCIAVIHEFGLCAVRTVQIPDDGHDIYWLRQHVTRVALRLNLPAPKQLQLCGNQKKYWCSTAANPANNDFSCANLDDVADMTNAQALACSGMQL